MDKADSLAAVEEGEEWLVGVTQSTGAVVLPAETHKNITLKTQNEPS